VFVSQRQDGVWDVVDGVQRLSTIYEFVGKLKNEDGLKLPPFILEKTDYLPSIEGKKWEDQEDEENSLTTAQRLLIKRAKIDVKILQRESEEMIKYELFQRLNTGGTPASPQEVRNCILVMLNAKMFHWMRGLSQKENFRTCTSLSDTPLEEQYDVELVLRFLVFRSIDDALLRTVGNDVSDFLTKQMVSMAKNKDLNYEEEEQAFNLTFSMLEKWLGESAFRKYDNIKQRFIGGFSVSAFEAISTGVGYNYKFLSQENVNLLPRVRNIWQDLTFKSNTGSGINLQRRVKALVPLGRRFFSDEYPNS
jgi:hypothetical protein